MWIRFQKGPKCKKNQKKGSIAKKKVSNIICGKNVLANMHYIYVEIRFWQICTTYVEGGSIVNDYHGRSKEIERQHW